MCDTLVVVESERVLFAKNSDRDPNEAQLLDWQPRHAYPPGNRLRCTWIEIPQIEFTHAVLLSRPYWMWGAEMGANEHGVVIGNEAVFTREPLAETGLTGMDLVRLVLERAASARQGVDVLLALLAEHGQGGGCGHERRQFSYHNSFLVADTTGAFVVETAGRHSAVEVVRGARSISNGLTIPSFAAEHRDCLRERVSACAVRRARTESLASGATQVGDLIHILRDHGPRATGPQGVAPHYAWHNGGMTGACMHAGGFVAASQTTASWVAELRPGQASHWVTGTAAPCWSLFKPVRVGESLDLGPAPTDRAEERSLWWRHERLHRRVVCAPARWQARFAAERDGLEASWIAQPPSPAEAFAAGDQLLGRWLVELNRQPPAADERPWWVRSYWKRRNRRAGLKL